MRKDEALDLLLEKTSHYVYTQLLIQRPTPCPHTDDTFQAWVHEVVAGVKSVYNPYFFDYWLTEHYKGNQRIKGGTVRRRKDRALQRLPVATRHFLKQQLLAFERPPCPPDNVAYRAWVEAFIAHFEAEYGLFYHDWRQHEYGGEDKPGVLLTGRIGAGKSTLINSILPDAHAEAGTGNPVTTTFTPYTDYRTPITLYDSPGIEPGKAGDKTYRKNIERFLKRHRKQIKAVWYVISAPSTRITDYEFDLMQTTFKKLSLYLILSKCDITQDEQIIDMLRHITSANIPNIESTYELAAEPLNLDDPELLERFGYHDFLNDTIKKIVDEDTYKLWAG